MRLTALAGALCFAACLTIPPQNRALASVISTFLCIAEKHALFLHRLKTIGKRKAQVAAGAGALWGSGDAQASTVRPRALFRFNGSHGFALAAGTPGRQPPPAFEGAVGRRSQQGTYEPRHRCSPPGAPAVTRGSSALPLSGSAGGVLRSGAFLGSAAAQRARGASSRIKSGRPLSRVRGATRSGFFARRRSGHIAAAARLKQIRPSPGARWAAVWALWRAVGARWHSPWASCHTARGAQARQRGARWPAV